MSCCGANPGYDELDEVSRLVSAKLAAFLRTLRDNGFAVGLHEGRDAAALMAAGYAARPGLLRSAFKHLFSARKSDWEKFDGLFDAFWLGDLAAAARQQETLDLIRTTLQDGRHLALYKHILEARGLRCGDVRPPLPHSTAEEQAAAVERLTAAQLL